MKAATPIVLPTSDADKKNRDYAQFAINDNFRQLTNTLSEIQEYGGIPGPQGPAGEAAGFGTPTATATTSDTPTASVTAEGPDTAKIFNFAFGFPATRIEFVKLWENPSPGSNVPAKTEVNWTGGAYAMYLIRFLITTNDYSADQNVIAFSGQTVGVVMSRASANYFKRSCTISTGQAVFADGYKNGTASGAAAIPYQIYGISGVTVS